MQPSSALNAFWKTFRHLLEGRETFSPKDSLRTAYQMGWIHDKPVWLALLQDRNLTSHTYREELATRIVENIHPEMERTVQFLKNRFLQE